VVQEQRSQAAGKSDRCGDAYGCRARAADGCRPDASSDGMPGGPQTPGCTGTALAWPGVTRSQAAATASAARARQRTRAAPVGLAAAWPALLLGPTAWSLATAATVQTGGTQCPASRREIPLRRLQSGVGSAASVRAGDRCPARTSPDTAGHVVAGPPDHRDWIAATSGADGCRGSSSRLVDRSGHGRLHRQRPSPTLAQFQSWCGGGLRYVAAPVRSGFAGFLGGSDSRTRDTGSVLPVSRSRIRASAATQVSGRRLYDCAPDAPLRESPPARESTTANAWRDAVRRPPSQMARRVTSWRGAADGRPDG